MAYLGKVPADVLIDPLVTSASLVDGTIITADIANDAVTSAKLAANSVDSSELINGSIDNDHLAGSIAINKTLLAGGTGLTLSTNTLNVDAAQTQITSVGTIGTGVWQGTAVASAYLDADTAHLSTTQTFSGAKTFSTYIQLNASASTSSYLQFATGGTTYGYVGSESSVVSGGTASDMTIGASGDTNLTLTTNGAVRATLNSSGATFAGTIFQGTTSPTLYSSVRGIVFENGALINDVTRGAGKSITLAQNVAIDSGNTWAYLATDEASYYQQFGGNHYFATCASGSAGADATLTSKLTIANDGTSTFAGDIVLDKTSDPSIILKRPNASAQINKILTDSAGLYIQSYGHATGGNNQIIFMTEDSDSSSSPTERMRITSAGNVMLGNQTMTNHTNQTLGLRGTSNSGVSAITFLTTYPSTAGRSFAWASNYTAHGAFDLRCSENRDGTPFHTRLMTIDGNGNVGIGCTPSADYKLHIENSSSPIFAIQDTTNNCVGYMQAGDTTVVMGSKSNHNLQLRTNDVVRVTIETDGDMITNRIYPNANNSHNSGDNNYRWATVYGVTSNFSSDQTLKKNISTSDLGADFINSLNPVKFNWKKSFGDDTKQHYGFLAQEIKETELSDSVDGEEGSMGMNYNDLIAPMVKAIQELSAEVEKLKGN